MSTLQITAIIATTIIFSTTICIVSGQAPSPAPFSALGPSAPGPSSSTFGPSAPEPTSNDCVTQLFNLTDCLTYVEEGSNSTTPDKNCCPELAGLVESNPICLCELLGNTSAVASFGIKIDIKKALKLPSVCGVSTPPVSLCSAVGYPIGAPSANEVSKPPGGQPTAVAANPSSGNNDSGASSSMGGCAQAFFVGLAFAILLTFF